MGLTEIILKSSPFFIFFQISSFSLCWDKENFTLYSLYIKLVSNIIFYSIFPRLIFLEMFEANIIEKHVTCMYKKKLQYLCGKFNLQRHNIYTVKNCFRHVSILTPSLPVAPSHPLLLASWLAQSALGINKDALKAWIKIGTYYKSCFRYL